MQDRRKKYPALSTRNTNELEASVKTYFTLNVKFPRLLCEANPRTSFQAFFNDTGFPISETWIKVLSISEYSNCEIDQLMSLACTVCDDELNVLVVEVQENSTTGLFPFQAELSGKFTLLSIKPLIHRPLLVKG